MFFTRVFVYMCKNKRTGDIDITRNPPPFRSTMRRFGDNLTEKIRIMGRNANKSVAELDNQEINIMLGGIHVCAAGVVGNARKRVRMDYRTRSRPPQVRGLRWLIDTGCGHDLIKESHAKRLGLEKHFYKSVKVHKH